MATSDESALHALLLEYAEAVRSGDAQRCAASWTEHGTWVISSGNAEGRSAITELWAKIRSEYTMVVQLYLAATFDVEGDTATGRSQMVEFDTTPDGTRSLAAGHYDDTYERTADGWKFVSRQWTRYFKWSP